MLGGTSSGVWGPDFALDAYGHDLRVPHSTVRTAALPQTSHPAATFVVATEPPEALTGNGYGTTSVELAESAAATVTVTVTADEVTTVRLCGAHRQGRPATFRMKQDRCRARVARCPRRRQNNVSSSCDIRPRKNECNYGGDSI